MEGGVQNISLRRLQAVGRHLTVTSNPGRKVGSSNPGQWTVVRRAAAIFARPGFEPPPKKSVASCITVRPLIALMAAALPTAWSRVCH